MKRIGITGPTGAGKTTALSVLAGLGVCILDADAVYYELLSQDGCLKKQLRERFGGGILDESGGIDRKKLGELVFPNPEALRDLNAIAHRFVLAEIDRRAEEAQMKGAPAVAIDAIALIESGVGETCDPVISVLAPAETRIRRIMVRDRISEEYARRRVAAQQPDDFYRTHSDYVLENNDTDRPEVFAARALEYFKTIL